MRGLTVQQMRDMGYTETEPGIFRKIGQPTHAKAPLCASVATEGTKTPKTPKPRLNKLETRFKGVLASRGITGIMEQAITLRLDPPFKSYTPDLAWIDTSWCGAHSLVLVEVKGPHRFRRAGIAKAALAAKTYPQFRFELADWTGKEWKESVLSP